MLLLNVLESGFQTTTSGFESGFQVGTQSHVAVAVNDTTKLMRNDFDIQVIVYLNSTFSI